MESTPHRFCDLSTLAPDVHALFDAWIDEATRDDEGRYPSGDALPGPDALTLLRLKLAVHEWVANLVQHARFDGRPPLVTIRLDLVADGVLCEVEDNSDGFDLVAILHERQEHLEPMPERGMGLLFLQACTARLSYGPLSAGGHRLTIVVAPEQDAFVDLMPESV